MMTREFIKQLRERNVDDGHVVHLNRYIYCGVYDECVKFSVPYICRLKSHSCASSFITPL